MLDTLVDLQYSSTIDFIHAQNIINNYNPFTLSNPLSVHNFSITSSRVIFLFLYASNIVSNDVVSIIRVPFLSATLRVFFYRSVSTFSVASSEKFTFYLAFFKWFVTKYYLHLFTHFIHIL